LEFPQKKIKRRNTPFAKLQIPNPIGLPHIMMFARQAAHPSRPQTLHLLSVHEE
jgi:hypothetical protein